MTPEREAALLRELAPLQAAAMSMYEEGRFDAAADAMEAVCARSAGLGPSHPFHLDRLSELAAFHHLSGRTGVAHAVYGHVLARTRESGARDADFGRLLANYAELCRETGDLAQAEGLATEALGILAATRGRRDADHASALEALARILRQRGDLPRARTLLRQALRTKRALPGVPPRSLGTCLNTLAAVHLDEGRYGAALALVEEALSIVRPSLGDRHRDVAVAVGSQAMILAEMGELTRAEALMRESLGLYREALGSGHPETANAMDCLARILLRGWKLGEAEDLLLGAIELYLQAEAAGSPQELEALNTLAQLRYLQGRHAAADAIYTAVIEAQERALGPRHPLLATLLSNRAQLARDTAHPARARSLYERAAEILRQAVGSNHPEFIRVVVGLSALHQDMGDLQRALRLITRALAAQRKSLGDHHPEVALSLARMGSIQSERHQVGRAAAAYAEALAIHHANGTADGVDAAQLLNDLAVLSMEAGDFARAELLHRRSLRATRKRLGPSHRGVGDSLHNLATLRHHAGRCARAVALERRALKVLEAALGDAHPRVSQSMYSLAFYLAARGRHAAALRMAMRAEEAFDRTLHAVLAASSERQRIGYLEMIRQQQDIFLSLACLPMRGPRGALAAADLVLRRKGITAEVLSAQRMNARTSPGALSVHLERLGELRLRIARKTLDGPGAEGATAHRRLLAAWEDERDRLEAALAAHVPDLRLERQLRAADRHAVASALPPGAALVELAQYAPVAFTARPGFGRAQIGARRYVALVIRSGEPGRLKMVELGTVAHIDACVAGFRAAGRHRARELGSTGDEADHGGGDDAGDSLRAAVLDPLLPALRGATRLFVAPDGDLALLPWEALPLADGRRVIDRFCVSYLTTGRDLLRLAAPRDGQPRPPVVVAAPDYDLPPGSPDAGDDRAAPSPRKADARPRGRHSRDLRGAWFSPLGSAAQEGVRVAELLGVAPLLGAEALERRVKEVRSPAVLHVATHGFFLGDRGTGRRSGGQDALVAVDPFARLGRVENPLLRSGLALAGANRWLRGLPLPPEAEDGLLTAEDVSALDLHATELVVLSACDTGVGRTRVGEGVFGLRRAFVLAGARTLVTSLWSVPDAETRELMEDFYRRLLAGAPRAEALREAQLAIRERHPDPWFWGGFICQGDPGPLPAALLRVAAPGADPGAHGSREERR